MNFLTEKKLSWKVVTEPEKDQSKEITEIINNWLKKHRNQRALDYIRAKFKVEADEYQYANDNILITQFFENDDPPPFLHYDSFDAVKNAILIWYAQTRAAHKGDARAEMVYIRHIFSRKHLLFFRA